jgi:hypothetical protein
MWGKTGVIPAVCCGGNGAYYLSNNGESVAQVSKTSIDALVEDIKKVLNVIGELENTFVSLPRWRNRLDA